MSTGQTTMTQIDPGVRIAYDRVLLKRGLENLVLEQFAQKKPVQTKSGDQPKFRRYNSLPNAIVPLTVGQNPTPVTLSKTDIPAQIKKYGQVVEVAEEVDLFTQEPVLAEEMMLLGESWGRSREMIIRDILNAGTNYYRANGVSARTDIVSKALEADFKKIRRTLEKNLASLVTGMVPGADKANTYSVPPSFIAVCGPEAKYDIEGLTGFTKVKDYSNPGIAYKGEFGSLHNMRFIMSEISKVFPDAGGNRPDTTYASTTGGSPGKCDVHTCLIFGQNAFGITDLSGKAKQIIVKPASEIGGSLEVYGTAGWKMFMDALILNQLWIVRYEFSVSA